MLRSLPVVVCGKSPQVAAGVINGIRPAYNAIHVITSVESGVKDIPYLLQGLAPPPKDLKNFGSQEYGEKVMAVLIGGGYNDSDFEKMRKACEGESKVPWLRHDIQKDVIYGQEGQKLGVGYGDGLAKRIVLRLQDLEKNNKTREDGVYWF